MRLKIKKAEKRKKKMSGTDYLRYEIAVREVILALALLGIVTAVSVPQYIKYTGDRQFRELDQLMIAARAQIDACMIHQGAIERCDEWSELNGKSPTQISEMVKTDHLLADDNELKVTLTALNTLTLTETSLIYTGTLERGDDQLSWRLDPLSQCANRRC